MASLRDYYDTDFDAGRFMRVQAVIQLHATASDGVRSFDLPVAILWSVDANARFMAFYLDAGAAALDSVTAIVDQAQSLHDREFVGLEVKSGARIGERTDDFDSLELVDTNLVHIYVDRIVSDAERDALRAYARAKGSTLRIRDLAWAAMRDEREKPVVFISHDSRDKDEIARPLAQMLTKLGCPVWFDEFSLKMGDSLRESIERGLRDCRGCVLIMTKKFFSNGGWTKMEFDSVFQREILQKQNVLLPVWAGVSKDDVYAYAPRLLDRLGVDWGRGAEDVARAVLKAVGRE